MFMDEQLQGAHASCSERQYDSQWGETSFLTVGETETCFWLQCAECEIAPTGSNLLGLFAFEVVF